MKALAVLTKSLYEKLDDKDKFLFPLDETKIPVGLVETKIPDFNKESDNYANTVLVQKAGFSLNYRDLGIMEHAWDKLKNIDFDTYYPIGSDFSGYIRKFGKNVTGFKEGDMVIGDGSYPAGKHNSFPGIPSNHASKEWEIYHYGKLTKIEQNFPVELASGATIGTQTGYSMVKKAAIKKGSNVLVTSVTSSTSLYLLNLLKDLDCNVYGLSYSGKNVEAIKENFPFLKDVFLFQERNVPEQLLFDAVLDPFSDTHIPYLIRHLNYDAKYITCGVYNQSSHKIKNVKEYKISSLFAFLLMKNVSFIGNCLGTADDLTDGLDVLMKNNKMLVDSVFTSNDSVADFMNKTYHSLERQGKVIFKY